MWHNIDRDFEIWTKKFTYDDNRDGRWVLLRLGGLFQKRHGCSLGQSRH